MQNIEYLSERDLKYFEKKEALGEAIIIRIEPEALLSLDLDALFQDHPKDQTLSAEELELFLHGKNMNGSDKVEQKNQDTAVYDLENDLKSVSLSEEQKFTFLQAVRSGATDEELMRILQNEKVN
ncbi:hypothetical protein [Porcincola intestinalis]|uniref:Uncharacterized protein n=1 Tax=Porcincola intestinalis TaxID=2606632 RepID=A0A6L5X0T8_9FIRM|nr:hypothetical protein [Porcincola intestinalis]MSS13999.1 hypothetical protein [Porcincola intestinalis]